MNALSWLTVLCLVPLSSAESPGKSPGESILLPRGDGLEVPLAATLRGRRSTRSFDSERQLSRLQLGDLLWATSGVNRPDPTHPHGGKRTAPSAFGSCAVDAVVTFSEGTFRYDPRTHALVPFGKRGAKDLRPQVTRSAWVRKAPVVVLLVANLDRYPERVGREERRLYAHADAAVMAQNHYLACAALGLGTVLTVGARELAGTALGLGEDQEVVFVLPVGYAAVETAAAPRESNAPIHVVLNRAAWTHGDAEFAAVVKASRVLVGGAEKRILDAGRAYAEEHGGPLTVDGPSAEATEKARWLRNWLLPRVERGATLLLVGDEKALPTWRVSFGRQLTSDSFYSDLDGDGIPETAVCRVRGSPDLMIRQLKGKKDYGPRAAILCSEDTRIHLETRAFARSLSGLGYEPSISGVRNDEALVSSDFIVHFGHGSPTEISNRFGETFVSASSMPSLPRSPVVFVDGCGTLPVGSPLLHAFLEKGAIAYVGSTETVQGMIPARFTNELVEHFLRILAERPGATLPRVLTAARAAYVRGHPGLAEKLRELASTGRVEAHGDEATHLLTVVEWVYYGDPRAVLPRVRPAREMSRRVVALGTAVRLEPKSRSWSARFDAKAEKGQAVLSVHADVPLAERRRFSLAVEQNGAEVARLDGNDDTIYQNLGASCRGGHRRGAMYRARFLVPLRPGEGEQLLEVRLTRGSFALLDRGTGVEIWPADFEKRIGLRHAPAPRRSAPRVSREPIKAVGKVQIAATGTPGYSAVDLSSVFNRSHGSVQVGGGDNASFRSWFSSERVSSEGVPFIVRRTGKDVLVSANNTENVFELRGLEVAARKLHLLVWGYNFARSASLRVTFSDGTSQDWDMTLDEWTRPRTAFAFDFKNTVRHFRHAAVLRRTLKIDHPKKKIVRISSRGGTYGLIAVTLEE